MTLSKTRSVPPYAICNDATLIDMCIRKPESIEELRFVKGMGDSKIRSIGHAFIKVITKFKIENE